MGSIARPKDEEPEQVVACPLDRVCRMKLRHCMKEFKGISYQ